MNVVGHHVVWASLSLMIVGVASVAVSNKRLPLKDTWPWYHSADEIHANLQDLVGQCQGAEAALTQQTELNSAEAAGQSVTLDVLRIQRSGTGAKKKAMFVFGEHAREIISPETALSLAQALCGHGPHATWASKVLDKVSFTLVPNANPLGRKQVEDGYYCKRTNEDGVDLNRNFGNDHRDTEKRGDETNAGPEGFSEPESKMLKSLIDDERPDIYVSVHSGAYLLGTPFGYARDELPDNEANMMEVLRPVSEKYCDGNCPYGNLAELIHYDSPGCDIDYVSEKVGTPFVFTWEIYVGERFRGPYIEEARLRRKHASDAKLFQLSLIEQQKRKRVTTKFLGHAEAEISAMTAAWKRMEEPENEELVDNCMDQFNPQSQDETDEVVTKWTSAYLELCDQVANKTANAQQAAYSASWDSLTALTSPN